MPCRQQSGCVRAHRPPCFHASLAYSAAKVCHLDRPRGSEATECEWRDPRGWVHRDADSGSSTERLSPKSHFAAPISRLGENCIQVRRVSGKGWHEQLGENTSYRHGRGRILGISPLPFGPLRQAQGPSESVEMTDISSSGEPSILMPQANTS